MQWDLAYLPQQLQDIIEIIGLPAAKRLVEHYGGVSVMVPPQMREDHALARLLGLEAAQKLVEQYARERITVPRAYRAIIAFRNSLIRAAHADGKTAKELALLHGITERWIWNILANETADDSQKDLFDDE